MSENKHTHAHTQLPPHPRPESCTKKFPEQLDNKVRLFPALLSDVMPLWVWVDSRGPYKGKRRHLKCHPAAGAWLAPLCPHCTCVEQKLISNELHYSLAQSLGSGFCLQPAVRIQESECKTTSRLLSLDLPVVLW